MDDTATSETGETVKKPKKVLGDVEFSDDSLDAKETFGNCVHQQAFTKNKNCEDWYSDDSLNDDLDKIEGDSLENILEIHDVEDTEKLPDDSLENVPEESLPPIVTDESSFPVVSGVHVKPEDGIVDSVRIDQVENLLPAAEEDKLDSKADKNLNDARDTTCIR